MNKTPTIPCSLYHTEEKKQPKVFIFLQDNYNFTEATATGTPVMPAL